MKNNFVLLMVLATFTLLCTQCNGGSGSTAAVNPVMALCSTMYEISNCTRPNPTLSQNTEINSCITNQDIVNKCANSSGLETSKQMNDCITSSNLKSQCGSAITNEVQANFYTCLGAIPPNDCLTAIRNFK